MAVGPAPAGKICLRESSGPAIHPATAPATLSKTRGSMGSREAFFPGVSPPFLTALAVCFLFDTASSRNPGTVSHTYRVGSKPRGCLPTIRNARARACQGAGGTLAGRLEHAGFASRGKSCSREASAGPDFATIPCYEGIQSGCFCADGGASASSLESSTSTAEPGAMSKPTASFPAG